MTDVARQAPVVEPVPLELLEAELERLVPLLDPSERYAVFATSADRIPNVLREIGRLREVTFRAVGEGTGEELDLDRFDAAYTHLWVWDRGQRRIAGSYRLRLVGPAGVRGAHELYTRTLFAFDDRLITSLGHAMELGRSFVRQEDQRSSPILSLLWRGIGALLHEWKPRTLFGALTISPDYSTRARDLLAAFLLSHPDELRTPLVAPLHPLDPGSRPIGDLEASNLAELEELVRDFEGTRRGVPVLVREYLRLNARCLGLSLDPTFANSLDALVTLDVTRIPPAKLARFVGRERTAQLLEHLRSRDAATGRAPSFASSSSAP